MEMSPPPYQGQSDSIKLIHSKDLRIDPAARTAWIDALEQAEQALPPIRERLDALLCVDGWCKPRMIEVELDHLDMVLSGYHLRRYMTTVLETLREAEADLATWQQMTPAQQDERWDARERENAERAERRKRQSEISAKQNAFYTSLCAMGIAPIPMSAETIAESARALNDIERQISNMGNHLYE
jgi:hypothetical protein